MLVLVAVVQGGASVAVSEAQLLFRVIQLLRAMASRRTWD